MGERSILKSKLGLVPHPSTLNKGLARWIPTIMLLFSNGFLFSEGMYVRNKKGQKVYFPDYPFKPLLLKTFLFATKCPGIGLLGIIIGFFLQKFTGPNCIFDWLENTLPRYRTLLFFIPGQAGTQECFDHFLASRSRLSLGQASRE
jgi:hypothetical protein